MKILNLRFKNLNSLYGEWEIDFTVKEFVSNGIFAIVGPTGSGKTTILDAICLALYGATPRLKNISKSTNEIMSQKTGECFAEVTFRVNSGVYTCHWSQRRARKSPEGNLAESKHEISDSNTKKILATKKRDVALLVESKCGMDMDRFTRSILLAQGSFAAFLQATPDQKSPILEQITGTDIYSNISIKIHEKLKEETQKLSVITAKSSGILTLSEEEEELIKKEILDLERLNLELTSKEKELNRVLIWKNNLDKIDKEINELKNKHSVALNNKEEFKQKEAFLKNVVKASELDSKFSVINTLKTQLEKDEKELLIIENKLPASLDSLQTEKLLFDKSSIKLKEKKDTLIKEKEVIKAVNYLDNQIKQLEYITSNKNDSVVNLKLKSKKLNEIIDLKKLQINNNQENLKKTNMFLSENVDCKELSLAISGIKLEFNNLKENLDKKYFKDVEIEKTNKELSIHVVNGETNTKELEVLTKELRLIEEKYNDTNNKLNELTKEKDTKNIRTELGYLFKEKLLINKIVSLEKERLELVNGEPCPLCGSKDHPFAINNTPELNEVDHKIFVLEKLLEDIYSTEIELKNLLTNIQGVKDKIVETEKKNISSQLQITELEKSLDKLKHESREIETLYTKKELFLSQDLKKYGVNDFKFPMIEVITEFLESKVEKWNMTLKKEQELTEAFLKISSETENHVKDFENINIELNKQDLEYQEELSKLKDLNNSRVKLYGNKDPEAEENIIISEIEKLEMDLNNKRILIDELINTKTILETKRKSILDGIHSNSEEFKVLEIDFIESLNKIGFISIDEYKKYKIPTEEKDNLIEKKKDLDRTLELVESKLQELITKQKFELETGPSELESEEIESELNQLEVKIKNINQEYGALKQKLTVSSLAKDNQREIEEQISKQKVELENWQKLHNLIGSADGKKFRNFAQGITFENMIIHANNELLKLSDRYLLIKDSEIPLELSIIDNYQGGDIRSTRNLSGGESFIISLALALGLSNMSSSKVRVDSLFLDEGFGTLDQDALDLALETLSGLHQDGKIIGIISHVPALKQRIPVKISISKRAGGRGVIHGPGCKQNRDELF